MPAIDIVNDICPVTDFRANTNSYIQRVRGNHRPVILTVNGRSSVVVMGIEDYNTIISENEALRAIDRGRADVKAGRTVSHAELQKKMKAKFENA